MYIIYNHFIIFKGGETLKLFKNRGDIYIPKSSRKGNQAKLLYILLAATVVFTAVFVIFLSSRYSSVKDFFAVGEVSVTQNEIQEQELLPEISGKTNFLIIETDSENTLIHYAFLIQADKSNKAYKVSALSPDTLINDKTLSDIYFASDGAALQSEIMEYFGFDVDFYAVFDSASFIQFTNKLGSFVYNSYEDISFSGGGEDDKYTLRIKEGEQNISGRELSNLLRYYSSETHNYAAENELVLLALSGLFNYDNFSSADQLYKLFVKSATTDITVREYENAKDALMVFTYLSNDITLYSSVAEYDENGALTQNATSDIKGYFSK